MIFWTVIASAQKPLISLSDEEKQWLSEHHTLRLGVGVAFPPFMWVEKKDGQNIFKGMVSDYVDLLGERLGVDMQIVFGIPFNEALARGRTGRIDFFPCLSKTPERSEFLLFTEPYLSYPLVIITREDAPLVGGMEDLRGKRFAVVKHLVVYSKMKNDYPALDLNYVFTSKVDENLDIVSLGRADACIINLAAASYYIQRKGLTNLRIASPVDWKGVQLSMGMRKDWPILQGIMKKALASVSQQEKDRISQRWIRFDHDLGVDIGLIWRWSLGLGLGITALFALVFAWNRRLQKEITRRKRAEKAIEARARQQAAISELGQKVLGNKDLSTLMQEAVTLVGLTLEVNNVKILKLLPDNDSLLLLAGVGWKEGLVGKATVDAGEDSQAGYTLVYNEPVIVEDLALETRFNDPQLLFDHGIVSGLSVVIGERSRPFGVLGAYTGHRHDFSKNDVNFLLSVANVLATAIERKKTEKRIEQLNYLKEELLTTPSLMDRLKRITDGILDIFQVDFARIWTIEKGDLCETGCMHASVAEGPHVCRQRDRCLHLLASSGRYTHTDGAHGRVPFGSYKIGLIASREEFKLVSTDVVNDPRVHDREWARQLGLVSFAGYRILSPENVPLGVLALFSKNSILPDEDMLLEGLSNTTAQVIQTDKIEKARKESEARYRKLISQMLNGFALHEIICDDMGRPVDYRFLEVNPAFEKITGLKAKKIIGKTVKQILPDTERHWIDNYGRVALTGESIWLENYSAELGRYFDVLAYSPMQNQFVTVFTDITDRKQIEEEREKLIEELRTALDEVKTLQGFIPICASCKNIRDDEGYWKKLEQYVQDHSDAQFSHSICPDCAKKLYPDLDIHDD